MNKANLSKLKDYREWLEKQRVGLPPMPQDYIDEQIISVSLYLSWTEENK